MSDVANLFKSPLLGPFVEPNGLSGPANSGEHLCVSITWSSSVGTFRLDLIRLPTHWIWREKLGFSQAPGLEFEQFLWECFAHSSRLTDFLNELRPYIRPSSGAPTPAPAAEWLNPKLVACGFSLGTAKVHSAGLRIPVVWVFGKEGQDWGSERTYARVDFVHWSPDEVRLLRRYATDCWGTGARALRRYLHQLVDRGCGPLLTEKGLARMQELYQQALAKGGKIPKPLTRLNDTDLTIAADLRRILRHLSAPLSAEVASQVGLLSPKAYAGILSTCVVRGLQSAAHAFLSHRPLPEYGRSKLLEKIIAARWTGIFDLCANELQQALATSRYGHNPLLQLALETADPHLIGRLLGVLSSMDREMVAVALEQAFELGHEDMVLVILTAQVVQPVRAESMLQCFKNCLCSWKNHRAFALRLLEHGVRPIKALDFDFFISPKHELIEADNLPVLKEALKLEPPTPASLSNLLDGSWLEPGETLDWLCSLSRQMTNHLERMSRLALSAITVFIYRGEHSRLALMDQALAEGGTLAEIPWYDIEKHKFLQGYGWQHRRDNLIDLIGHLQKSGRQQEIAILKRISRKIRTNQAREL